jgi:hypothetical protein
MVTVLTEQQPAFCSFGLEHQPSPRGWAESSPVAYLAQFFFFWAGSGPVPKIFKKNIFEKICDFPV